MANGILGNIGKGLIAFGANKSFAEVDRNFKTRDLLGQLGGIQEQGGNVLQSQQLQQLAAVNPQEAARLTESIAGFQEMETSQLEERKRAFFNDAAGAFDLSVTQGKPALAISFLEGRVSEIERLGGDPSDTLEPLELLRSGDPLKIEQANDMLRDTAAIGLAGKFIETNDPALTARQLEFAQFQAMEEGPEKNAFGRLIGATPKREGAVDSAERERLKAQAKLSQSRAAKAFDKLPGIKKSILNIDRAITALGKGAATGVIESMLPSIQDASIELENIRSEMGLDIVGAATFGALSESELNFALDLALPDTLEPVALTAWLERKKDVQTKLANGLRDQAIFFSKGGTIAELLEKEREAQQAAPQQAPAGAAPQAAAPAAQAVTPVAPRAGGVPVVATQADFDALPSGALFTEDGKQYRKP